MSRETVLEVGKTYDVEVDAEGVWTRFRGTLERVRIENAGGGVWLRTSGVEVYVFDTGNGAEVRATEVGA